jgi:hypothetical protein
MPPPLRPKLWFNSTMPRGQTSGVPRQSVAPAVRGSIFGAQRIARHVWRMCIALFVASGSFFLGQQQVFPAAVRNTPILPILTFLPIVIMIFWLLRVGLAKASKGKWILHGGDGSSLQT